MAEKQLNEIQGLQPPALHGNEPKVVKALLETWNEKMNLFDPESLYVKLSDVPKEEIDDALIMLNDKKLIKVDYFHV